MYVLVWCYMVFWHILRHDNVLVAQDIMQMHAILCEIKVREYLSEPFDVTSGLRQGCVLSPLLFSLYINGAVEKLRAAKVGIMCREELVPALLIADDMVIYLCGRRRWVEEKSRSAWWMVQRVENEGECRQMWGDAYRKGCKENNVRILSWWRHGQSGAKLQIPRMHS